MIAWRTCVARLAFIAAAGTSASAQSLKPADVDKLSPEQVQALPMMDLVSAYAEREAKPGGRDSAVPDAQRRAGIRLRFNLAALYYPVDLSVKDPAQLDAQTVGQLKLFEATIEKKSAAYKVDGILTVGEAQELQRLANLSHAMPVYASDNDVFVSKFELRDYASVTATGTWEIQNDLIAMPLNWSSIECLRADALCEMREVDVVAPNSGTLSFTFDDHYLFNASALTNSFKITRWSENIVEARSIPLGAEPECRFTTMTINLSAKTVTQVTQDSDRQCEVLGKKMDRLGQPRVTVLKSPTEMFSKYFGELYAYVEKHYGSLAASAYSRPYLPEKYLTTPSKAKQ